MPRKSPTKDTTPAPEAPEKRGPGRPSKAPVPVPDKTPEKATAKKQPAPKTGKARRGPSSTGRNVTASFVTTRDFATKLDDRTADIGLSRSQAIERDITTYWTLTEIGLAAARLIVTVSEAETLSRVLEDIRFDAAHLYYLSGGGLPSLIQSKIPGPEGAALAGKLTNMDRLAVIGLADWASSEHPDTTGFLED